MSIAEANLELPPNFTGIVKVFPLPNLVLFPGVIQPLHIFEPRYRQLMKDSINGDQLIAMAKLKPDWEQYSGKNPEIHSTLCIGKIVTHAELPDGRFNLLLLGAKRAKIIRELASDLPYRLADVKILESDGEQMDSLDQPTRGQAIQLFENLVSCDDRLDRESIGHLLTDELPAGLLLDLLTFSCGASLGEQQDILETMDVVARANKVIAILKTRLLENQDEQSLRFPPKFSYN